MSKFFIADPLHINTKNFGSLYEYLSESKSTAILNEERQEWLSLFGDYSSKQDSLLEEYTYLQSLSSNELYKLSILEVNIFKSARAEILSLLITKTGFNDNALPSNIRDLFDLILEKEREVLLWNMASAIQWINYWSPTIKQHNPKFVLVFSGSLIYARTLLELLKNRAPRAFVLESFFTGSDNYIEEKYEPIANNSDLKFMAYYRSLGAGESPTERDRSRNKAINKILAAKNKNVTQPPENPKKLFTNSNPTLLIIGQVLNDFSVLEYKGVGLNTLAFYKETIEKIIQETNYNVVFKAHPWERKKKNIQAPFTLNSLKNYFLVNKHSYGCENRLLLLDDYNIKSVFEQTDYVLGLNSQALLEAAFEGFQPIQFADAFYGSKGFTSDYTPESLHKFVCDLNNETIPKKMGIEQYRLFEEFITKALQFSLVSAFPSGKVILKTIFQITPHIALTTNPVKKAVTVPANQVNPAQSTQPIQPSKNQSNAIDPTPEKSTKSKTKKKWAKFLKTPKKFFLDSKNTKIRWLHHFFWANS
jgi:hypothetical protein